MLVSSRRWQSSGVGVEAAANRNLRRYPRRRAAIGLFRLLGVLSNLATCAHAVYTHEAVTDWLHNIPVPALTSAFLSCTSPAAMSTIPALAAHPATCDCVRAGPRRRSFYRFATP